MRRSFTRVAAAAAYIPIAALALVAGACTSIDVPRAQGAPPRDAKNAFSHAEFDAVLKKFVNKNGRVDYGGLRLDHAQLDKYLGQLAQTSPDNDKSLFPNKWHRLAYWINAYNACAIKQVIERNITESVGDNLPARYDFFNRHRFDVGAELMCLDAIEDKAREIADARVHFLLNGGALGYPRLRAEASNGETFDKVAEDAGIEFCNESRNVETRKPDFDHPENYMMFSTVFKRRDSDFIEYAKVRGVSGPTIRDAVNVFRAKDARIPLNGNNEYRDFDWLLNKQDVAQK